MENAPEVSALLSSINVASILTALGLFGGLFAYGISARSAYLSRKRDQATKAIEQLLAFESDESVKAALEILDYPGADAVLLGALKPHFHRVADGRLVDVDFTADEKEARGNIDVLLSRLELIEGLIRHDVISAAEFGEQFRYWLELCAERPKEGDSITHLSDAARRSLWVYIRNYRFRDVVRLFRRYERAGEVDLLGDDAFRPRPT